MEPRAVVQRRTGRGRWLTSSSEPVRQVLAAWIVALFVLVGGFSVLVFYPRGVCHDGATAVIPRRHPPPVTGAEELDGTPRRSGARAWASESPVERDSTVRMIAHFRGDAAFMCSRNDHGEAQESSDCC